MPFQTIVTGGNRTKMFQFFKGILYQMPRFIQIPIHTHIQTLPVFFIRNIRPDAHIGKQLPESVRVITFVGSQHFG
jgi:hypothetical protein